MLANFRTMLPLAPISGNPSTGWILPQYKTYVKVVNNSFVVSENKDFVVPFFGLFWNILLAVVIIII